MKKINKKELLPNHYTEVGEPSYQGKGNHNIAQLEDIAEKYKELVHQLRLREQAILNKFSISIVIDSVCQSCKGTGKSAGHIVEGVGCFWCRGTGKTEL